MGRSGGSGSDWPPGSDACFFHHGQGVKVHKWKYSQVYKGPAPSSGGGGGVAVFALNFGASPMNDDSVDTRRL